MRRGFWIGGGGNLALQVTILKGVKTYDPLNGKDLSEVDGLRATLRELNMFLHRSCLPMTEELRLDFRVV